MWNYSFDSGTVSTLADEFPNNASFKKAVNRISHILDCRGCWVVEFCEQAQKELMELFSEISFYLHGADNVHETWLNAKDCLEHLVYRLERELKDLNWIKKKKRSSHLTDKVLTLNVLIDDFIDPEKLFRLIDEWLIFHEYIDPGLQWKTTASNLNSLVSVLLGLDFKVFKRDYPRKIIGSALCRRYRCTFHNDNWKESKEKKNRNKIQTDQGRQWNSLANTLNKYFQRIAHEQRF